MWAVVTSLGQRVDGIAHEHTALRTVHLMGMSTLLAPYRYLVTDSRGQRFHAEIRRTSSPSLHSSREWRVRRSCGRSRCQPRGS
jgi:hypothetical protein